ncbi:peptide MFS transporter [Pedobacter africanus]|uniref:POT family proton-dependent oligopeptide transporter n=2 Tax=Pedobacter africanus TaxID=151894 RepID=A0ACC6L0T5_9SPHI|nr:peptide MFS transporter [Pedobacter africanus]MDR6785214.1 POT family proton-dependent oligopeptide transporter [Pedobacter africanus]SMC41117.1 proton-dependent oligopeptide transporter, POT family [Pedobacter africanus]
MAKQLSLEEIQNFKGKYPKQLWALFFSEMWERFCFYGMRGMLTYFMVTQLFMKDVDANLQYGATQAFVYAFTFIGGLFADKILGFRKSLFWGGILMIIGSGILAYDPHQFFFLGISFTVVGTGFFKPNISTMVGKLYKAGDARRDAGFSVFYAGINIGALLGGYACITIGKQYSWHLAFGLAAIVMTISLITFLFTQKKMGPIGLPPGEDEEITDINLAGIDDKVMTEPVQVKRRSVNKKWYDYAVYIGSLAIVPVIMIMVAKTQYTDWFMYTIGPATLLYLLYEMGRYGWAERKKLIAALVFIFFSVLFWAFFEQCGGSLSLFAARNLDNTVLGSIKLDPNGVNNSANSLFVIIFAFLFSLIWIALAKKKIEPNTVVKFGLAFLFLAGSFFIFYSTRFFTNGQGIASLDVFTMAYLVMTFGELCLSPIGLSIMTKLSPVKLQGVMMGMWFLASAYGQYVAGLLGAGMAEASENDTLVQKLMTYTEGYKQLGIYALIAGIILLVISPVVKKLMQEVS